MLYKKSSSYSIAIASRKLIGLLHHLSTCLRNFWTSHCSSHWRKSDWTIFATLLVPKEPCSRSFPGVKSREARGKVCLSSGIQLRFVSALERSGGSIGGYDRYPPVEKATARTSCPLFSRKQALSGTKCMPLTFRIILHTSSQCKRLFLFYCRRCLGLYWL